MRNVSVETLFRNVHGKIPSKSPFDKIGDLKNQDVVFERRHPGGLKLFIRANPETFLATVGRIIRKRVGGVCWDGGNPSRINPILYTLYSGLVMGGISSFKGLRGLNS